MKHVVFARDLYYKILKNGNSEYLQFCIASGNRFRDIINNETVYHTDKSPLSRVWHENNNSGFSLNLPEEYSDDCNLFPKYLDEKTYLNYKLPVNELVDFEMNCNKKTNNEFRIIAFPSKINDMIAQCNAMSENAQKNAVTTNSIEF